MGFEIVQNIRARDVVAYVTMPRVVPRIRAFFSSGFGYVAFLMAQVFSVVRLLPAQHPYLVSSNIGRFGLRHVIAQAAGNLTLSFKNIDQILVFLVVLSGIVLLVVQFALFFYATLVSPVFAAVSYTLFDTEHPETDIAFSILDEVFGIPRLFCSLSDPTRCTDYATDYLGVSGGTGGTPLPFHAALQGMFKFYSTGLMMIAVFLFLYFLVVVMVETVTSGTPFGQRFQNFWVPVRLIVALGLLMPIDYGISSAQYIVLYAAKYGSGLATNGWNVYNDGVKAHKMFNTSNFSEEGLPLGEAKSYLVIPESPDITPLIQSMHIVHACAYAYHRLHSTYSGGGANKTTGASGDTYEDRSSNYAEEGQSLGDFQIQPFLVKTPSAGMVDGQLGESDIYGDPEERQLIENQTSVPYFSSSDEMDAIGFYYGSDIIIRFGEFRTKDGDENETEYSGEIGDVKPLCGDIRIPITDLSNVGGSMESPSEGGADAMQKFYYELVLELWFDEPELRQAGRSLVEFSVSSGEAARKAFCEANESSGGSNAAVGSVDGFVSSSECEDERLSTAWRSHIASKYNEKLKGQIIEAWEDYIKNSVYAEFEEKVRIRGWGGAGIWYNKIAEINGGWMDGVRTIPYMELYPKIMEDVKAEKQPHNQNSDVADMYHPFLAASSEKVSPKPIKVDGGPDVRDDVSIPLSEVYKFWNQPGDEQDNNKLQHTKTDNPFMNAITLLLGTTGLLDIRKDNQHVHPMAQLVAIGKGLVNSAVFNMVGATTGGFLGGMLGTFKQAGAVAGLVDAVSSLFYSTAFIGLTAGFVLFYVLPFMPFLYFFFSVANWVKAIFEAMLGAPLWALAHMRIDGEGLPGDAAANGYFLILEIFIRPILTVIGLLAAMIIFSVQVRILNLIWDMVTDNAAGFTEVDTILSTPPGDTIKYFRGKLDEFFFTLVYTIVCYMLGMANFKLIDKIPDHILRWAGSGASAYGDIDQDNVEALSRYASMGGMTIGNQAAGAVVQLSKGLGKGVGGALNEAITTPPATG